MYYVRDVKYVRRFRRQLAHSERYHYIVHLKENSFYVSAAHIYTISSSGSIKWKKKKKKRQVRQAGVAAEN